MQITPVHRSCLLFAVLCLGALPLAAQETYTRNNVEPAPGSDLPITTEQLTGVVVSSVDGTPLPRALVTSSDQRYAALTDSQGRFSFALNRTVSPVSGQIFSSFPPSPAPPSNATIAIYFNVRRPGYSAGNFSFSLPAIQPDSPEPMLTLKLVPTGVITGHIYPDSGELPRSVSIQLLRRFVANGTPNWIGAGEIKANSSGQFRFANLTPGDYKLFLPANLPDDTSATTNAPSRNGFLPTFYPNASTVETASSIGLTPGATESADLDLHAALFHQVVIPIANLPEKGDLRAVLLNAPPDLTLQTKGQSVEGYLPDGNYTLLLYSTPLNTGLVHPLSIAYLPLEIAGHALLMNPVGLHPAPSDPVVVRRDFTPGEPHSTLALNMPSISIGLQSVEQNNSVPPPSFIVHSGDQDLSVINLTPGEYRVTVYPRTSDPTYVASLTSGTTDLLAEPLEVLADSTPRPIEVTLRNDFASLEVTIVSNPTGLPIPVTCLSLDHKFSQPHIALSRQNHVTIEDLAPGRYLVFASPLQSDQPDDFTDPDLLHSLMQKGTIITLSPNQKASVQISIIPSGDN